MKKRKKRLKVFPIISLIVVIAVVAFAIKIVTQTFVNNGENINKDKTESTVSDDIETLTDTQIPSEDNNQQEENTENIIATEEDSIVYTDNAPKPIYTQRELLQNFPDTVLGVTEDAGNAYIDDMIFIGDSTTHGMAFYGVLKGGKDTDQVWTPKSGTLAMWNLLTENIVFPDDKSEMLIGDAIALKLPKIAVLTLGVNGVSSLTEDQFKKYYSDLIDLIKEKSPDTKIILQSIYPVCDYYEIKSISMEKINQANVWIVELAKEKEIHYLNTISALVDENGYLKNDYCNGDGIHISQTGFKVILEYIKTHSIYK